MRSRLTHTKLWPEGSSGRNSSIEKLVAGGFIVRMTSAIVGSSDRAANISKRNKVSPYSSAGSIHDNILPVNTTIRASLGAAIGKNNTRVI